MTSPWVIITHQQPCHISVCTSIRNYRIRTAVPLLCPCLRWNVKFFWEEWKRGGEESGTLSDTNIDQSNWSIKVKVHYLFNYSFDKCVSELDLYHNSQRLFRVSSIFEHTLHFSLRWRIITFLRLWYLDNWTTIFHPKHVYLR